MKTPAIYTITNLIDGKVYVGSSQHGKRRIYVHRWKLRRGTHDNIMLQRAWARDREAAFRFDIVETCALEDLLAREQAWIDKLRSTSDRDGYNFCPVAGSTLGVVMPESHRESARARFAGKPKSPEQRAAMSAAAKGKAKSPEHRAAIAEASRRQFSDPEARRSASEKTAAFFAANPKARKAARDRCAAILERPEVRSKQRAAVAAANRRRAEERRAAKLVP